MIMVAAGSWPTPVPTSSIFQIELPCAGLKLTFQRGWSSVRIGRDLPLALHRVDWHPCPPRPRSACRLHTPIDSQTVAWDVWSSLEIMKEVTRSLIFLHDHRILHGDLKAANVLLTSSSIDRRKYIAKV